MHEAVCDSCQKSFEISDPSKTYRCKECGGRVRAAGGAKRKSAGARRSLASPDQRRAASHVRQALGGLTWTRACLVLSAFVYGVLFMLAFFSILIPEFYFPDALLFTVMAGPCFLVMLLGCRQVLTQPFFWSIFLASLVTADVVVSFAMGEVTLFVFIKTAILVALWGGVAGAANIRKLLRQHPDMRINARLVARKGKLYRDKMSVEGRAATRSQARARAAARRRNQTLAVVVAVVIVLVVVVVVVIQLSRPQPLEKRVRLFVEAWNETTVAAASIPRLVSFCDETKRVTMARQLANAFKRYGWQESHPGLIPLDDDLVTDYSVCYANFSIVGFEADEPLKVMWKKDESNRWRLVGFRFPRGMSSP